MRPGHASKTAEHNALFRALETRLPRSERLICDPPAATFLSWPLRLVGATTLVPGLRRVILRTIDRRWPGTRTSVVARTRLIDETVADLVAHTPQVVVLGAGYDTRAWRLDALAGRTVFEVDHPDTQARKRELLARRGYATAAVRFVPTDFHLGRLDAAMAERGYAATTPTLFLWEGTTNYLDAPAVDATLRWCAGAAPGSHLVFTYIDEDVLTHPGRYVGAQRVFGTLRRAGERMTFGLDPETLGDYLGERGLELVDDVGAAEYRERCYGTRARAMRGHEFYRVARARVA